MNHITPFASMSSTNWWDSVVYRQTEAVQAYVTSRAISSSAASCSICSLDRWRRWRNRWPAGSLGWSAASIVIWGPLPGSVAWPRGCHRHRDGVGDRCVCWTRSAAMTVTLRCLIISNLNLHVCPGAQISRVALYLPIKKSINWTIRIGSHESK